MRRLSRLGVVLSASLLASCGGSSSNGGSGGSGGKGGAGAAGHGGTSGGAGHSSGGAGGQSLGGAGGQSGGGAAGHTSGGGAGQSAGGAAGQSAGGAAGQSAGGAGGQSAGGTAGQSAGGSAGQSSGGAGGQSVGGAAGQAAGGAAGGATGGAGGAAAVTCLDPSMFSAYFAIADSGYCAVALYTAPESLGFSSPSWGSHGGPLVLQGTTTGTDVTLERWSVPAGTSGTMTVQTTPVASAKPAGSYLGSQAIDLPFFGWTAISYTNSDFTGKIEAIASGAMAASYDADGIYSLAALPAASSLGRLLFSGLGPLGSTSSGTNGLYQADACSSPSQGLGAGTGCSASSLISGWGQASGPVATDSDGDVFAVMSSYAGAAAGTQEARGFLASSVARGAAATNGVTLFTVNGYGSSLAALSPTSTSPGVLLFQPDDSSTGDALDVIEQKFTTGGSLAAMGGQSTLLTVANAQSLSFMVDGSERLWVAASGGSSTTYVVLVRR